MTPVTKNTEGLRRRLAAAYERDALRRIVADAEHRKVRLRVETVAGDMLEGRPDGCASEYFNLTWGTRNGEGFGEREVYWGEVRALVPVERAEYTPDKDAFGILDMRGCRLLMPGGAVLRATLLHWNTERPRSLLWQVEGRHDLVDAEDVLRVEWDREAWLEEVWRRYFPEGLVP